MVWPRTRGDVIMAKSKPEPAALVKLPDTFGGAEVRFGKTDKVMKLAVSRSGDGEGWKVCDLSKGEMPTAVLFVGKDGQTFVADISRYPENVKGIMTFHGGKQKLGDEYADLDTVDDCLEAARNLDASLAEGKWFAERQGFAGISVLMRAIMKVYGIEEAAAREFLKPLSAKEKIALRAAPELKPTIDAIEAERAKKSEVDTAAVLGKLKKPE